MQKFKIRTPFYILFVLVAGTLLLPVSNWISDCIELIDLPILNELVNLGVVEAPTVVVLIGFLIWLYSSHLWKWSILNWIHGMPNVNGRYMGVIKSSYNGGSEYKCAVEITQTLTRVEISLFTKQSSSWSLVADPIRNEHGNWALAYVYTNRPKTASSDPDMKIHNGFATLDIFNDGSKLEGQYFNHSRERDTSGELVLKFKSRKRLGHF